MAAGGEKNFEMDGEGENWQDWMNSWREKAGELEEESASQMGKFKALVSRLAVTLMVGKYLLTGAPVTWLVGQPAQKLAQDIVLRNFPAAGG